MSLFKCKKCGVVENTNLVYPNVIEKLGEDENYPNMHLMDMHGFKDGHENEENGRFPYDMQCSECNTGLWHGQFDRKQANEIESKMADQLDDATFTNHPLYKIYEENSEEFDIKFLDMTKPINGKNRNVMDMLAGIASATGVDINDYLKGRKPHWKELQPIKEKNIALAKAFAKRERKRLAKSKK